MSSTVYYLFTFINWDKNNLPISQQLIHPKSVKKKNINNLYGVFIYQDIKYILYRFILCIFCILKYNYANYYRE